MAKGSKLGSWAFLIGLIIAVIIGLVPSTGTTLPMILVILGIIVGLLNVADKEVTPFLMSGAVLIIATALGQNAVSAVPYVGPVVNALLILFVPATIIVAVKNVFNIAKN